MSVIGAILLFFFSLFIIGLVQVLWHMYRGYRTVKKMMNGQLNEEDLQHMWGGKANSRSQQRSTQRTTQTSDGVTIIDQREPNEADKKIFASDEGEYVEFEEVN